MVAAAALGGESSRLPLTRARAEPSCPESKWTRRLEGLGSNFSENPDMLDELSELISAQSDSWEEGESPQMESSRLTVTVSGTEFVIKPILGFEELFGDGIQLSSRSGEFGIQERGGSGWVEERKWEELRCRGGISVVGLTGTRTVE